MTYLPIPARRPLGPEARGLRQLSPAAVLTANPIGSLQPQKLKSFTGIGRNKRQADSALEFACIAPILVVLILGMIEFGRVMMVEQVLSNAAREGCRHAALGDSTVTTQAVTDTVNGYLTGSNISGHTVSVSPNPGTAGPGTSIIVEVKVPFGSVSWLATPLFMGGTTELKATVTMRKEPGTNNM
jgi:hypothetical protein